MKKSLIFMAVATTFSLTAAQQASPATSVTPTPWAQNQSQNQPYSQYNQYASSQQQNQKYVSDESIARNIHDTIAKNLYDNGYPNINFEVYNGIVTLTGNVNRPDDKQRLASAISQIEGVKEIKNQITAPGDKTTADNGNKIQKNEKKYPQDFAATDADRDLNSRIRDKVSNGLFSDDFKTIVIQTRNGVVTISGTVEKFENVKKINDEIKKIDGVKSINNQLQVKKST